ncbi:PadR family transcriptional regulator [Bacillus megaterium]|nr:PadR family transcriptional regulator [Priestia megaterium]
MPRNDSLETGELTDTSYYILVSLIEAKHGYLIMKTIEDMTNQQFSIGPASMYTTIKKLLAAELIMLYGESKDKKENVCCNGKRNSVFKKEIQRRKEMIKHAEDILGGL